MIFGTLSNHQRNASKLLLLSIPSLTKYQLWGILPMVFCTKNKYWVHGFLALTSPPNFKGLIFSSKHKPWLLKLQQWKSIPCCWKLAPRKKKTHTKNAGERWLKCTSILLWELGLDFFKIQGEPPSYKWREITSISRVISAKWNPSFIFGHLYGV